MPELPEVETVVRGLQASVAGLRILQLQIFDEKLSHLEQSGLPSNGLGPAQRRGKYINLPLTDGRTLQIHLMMSGRLLLRDRAAPPDRFMRVQIGLDNGQQLRFCDPRRFGRIKVLAPEQLAAFDASLGPEPLARRFRAVDLANRLDGRRVALKTALLNQKVIAGIGNIYADEALWRARINPQRTAAGLDREQTRTLHRTLRQVLREAIDLGGTTFGIYANTHGQEGAFQEFLKVFRRTGQPCPRCRTPIARIVLGGRSTHYCPDCQVLPTD